MIGPQMDENGEWRLQHGGCAAYRSMGVLLLGPPGAGKSDLLLRLLDRKGWKLVADDQVLLRHHDGALLAQAPPALKGMLEVRGLGVLEGFETLDQVTVALAVACVPRPRVPRLPLPQLWRPAGPSAAASPPGGAVPLVALHPFDASAPRKVELGLLAARGLLSCHAGAFAPPPSPGAA